MLRIGRNKVLGYKRLILQKYRPNHGSVNAQVDRDSFLGCVRYIIRTTPNRQPVFYDSDEFVASTTTIVDEDYWLNLRPQTPTPSRSAFTDNDEAWPLGGLRIDEDQWDRPYQQVLPSSRQVFADNDENGSLGGFRLDEDDYRHSQLVRLITNVQPLVFDEDIGTPSTSAIDEDQWDRPFQQTLPFSRLVFTDNDEDWPLGGFRLDEDYWTYTTQPLVKNNQPIIDNDEDGPLGGFRLDEDYWTYTTQALIKNNQPITDVEELFVTAAPFGIEEDEWLWSLWRPQAIPYVPQQPVTDQDEKEGIPQPTPTDGDVWHGRRRKQHEHKAWPLPPPAFPLEKQEEILTFGDTTKTAFIPRWIETESKGVPAPSRKFEYLPVPVDFIVPTFSVIPPKIKTSPTGISTDELDRMKRHRAEEETIISFLMDEDD